MKPQATIGEQGSGNDRRLNSDPQKGERILDMCAAPGGKTTAVAILMKDKGEVVANDRSHNKVMDIKKLAAEMDLTCINAYKLDALKSVFRSTGTTNACKKDQTTEQLDGALKNSGSVIYSNDNTVACTTDNCQSDVLTETVINGKTSNGRYLSTAKLRKDAHRMRNGPGRNHCMGARVEISKGYMPNSFDRVLLDALCSALGLRPRLFAGEETVESLQNHAKYQRRMFDQAVQLVRPGGIIVYSTCMMYADLAEDRSTTTMTLVLGVAPQKGSHWVLLAINTLAGEVYYMDSMSVPYQNRTSLTRFINSVLTLTQTQSKLLREIDSKAMATKVDEFQRNWCACTINPGENEALVRYALDAYRFLSLAPHHPKIGGPGLIGHCELFDGKYREEWLTESEAVLVQRFDPSSSVDTIGFFIAKFNVGQKDI